ncbi:MAG TPA: MBL fold metallo-hydrolase [Solirubrobacteraceae bacterium]|jgi:glyoxylase-like metal-dependent hydrolase (beta-lactamase superfamily II)|nr:MBL fold metallo-hydrolase [Solirubrobacteraceae bacterium]
MASPATRPAAGYEIEEGLHTIGPTKHGMRKGGYSRAYLLEDGEHLTLVDSLFDDDAELIIQYLLSIGRSASELTDIVLTHAHRSHLGGVAALKRLSGARVLCHDREAAIVEGREQAPPVSLLPLRPLVLMPFRVLSYLHRPPHVPCPVDGTIGEGDSIGRLQVLHVPGHTPGHLAFLWKDRMLIVGDAILTWPSFGAGWPGFNLDEALYRRSLWRLVTMEPQIVGPGHGEPICDRTAERLHSLFSQPPA